MKLNHVNIFGEKKQFMQCLFKQWWKKFLARIRVLLLLIEGMINFHLM